MKSLLARSFGVLGYVLFLAVFVELTLQGFYYFTAGDFLFRRVALPIYAPNEHSGIFNKPNLAIDHHTQEFDAHYFTNGEGLRVARPGDEHARPKPGGVYRIMLLGPSFVFGWAVDYDETFGAVLEHELNERRVFDGRRVEVINAGVPSLHAAAQLRWYDHVGRSYQPDLVIQFIYGTMALSNTPVMDAVVDEAGYLVPRNASLARRLRESAKKLATVFYAWTIWTRLRSSGHGGGDGSQVIGAGRAMASGLEFDPARPEVADALGFYRDLERIVRRDGTELLVVYAPLSYAIHRADIERWKHLGVSDVPRQIAFDAVFADHLRGIGIPVANATAALQRAAESPERLYYWLDIHWTPKGNQVTAQAVADYLAGDPDWVARRRASETIPQTPAGANTIITR